MDDASAASAPRPPERRSIHLFDLDDTLIRTGARVLVRDRAGALVRALSTADFTAYKTGPDEVLDFSEFSDLGILSKGIVVRYTRSIIDSILRHGTQSEFGILTARGDKNLHAPFLIRFFRSIFGIRLSKEFIFTISDDRYSSYRDRVHPGAVPFARLSVSERKALVIAKDLVGRGFNDISFYDDSRDNLNSFKVLSREFPHVTFRPHFIDPSWTARLWEFVESGARRKHLIKGSASVRIMLEHHTFPKMDFHIAMLKLIDGQAIPLNPMPVEIVFEGEKLYLQRIGLGAQPVQQPGREPV